MNNNFCGILILVLLFGCTQPAKESDDRPMVVATTGMLYDGVLNIAGPLVNAQPIMGPGVDPHLYKATQGDLRKLRDADLIIYNGLFLEGKMAEILEKQGKVKSVIAAAETIPSEALIGSQLYANAYDPHVWFDVELWKLVILAITDGLIQLAPESKEVFKANSEQYLLQLDSLHQAVRDHIQKIPKKQRVLVTAHDAFGYFGAAYGIEVRGLQGISTLSEAGLKDIANTIDLVIENNIKAVFVETSVSTRDIQAVIDGCKGKGHQVVIGGRLFSDAMGEFGTFEGTYIGMVDSNVRTITKALK